MTPHQLCTFLANLAVIALPPREQRHPFLRYQGLEYTDAVIVDFESRLTWIYQRERKADPNKGDLRDYWIGISSAEDLLGIVSSYIAIQDPILRLCHRLIACSIAGRSQAPEKVTVTDLFYWRGMYFVAGLAEHFRLLTAEILQGLTIIAPKLLIIDIAKLVRLQICMEIDDTWDWVAMGPERLEEDVDEIRGALVEQRKVIGAMAKDFLRFTVWATNGITQIKPGSKFNTIVHEYVTEPSRGLVKEISMNIGEESTKSGDLKVLKS
ncbi:hypothetical protein Tco_0807851 [Tanacetum coccineum]